MAEKVETVCWNWSSYFKDNVLDQANSDEEKGYLKAFEAAPDEKSARGKTINGFEVTIGKAPSTYAELLEYPNWYDVRQNQDKYGSFRDYYSCTCTFSSNGNRCRHIANLLLHWEKVHGPFVFTVDPDVKRQYEEKKRKEKMDYIRRRGISLADEYFTYLDTPLPDDTFFQMDDLLSDAKLEFSLSEASIAEEFEHENHHDFTWNLVYNQEGEQVIQASWRNESRYARFSFTQNKIIQMDCNCGQMKLTTYSYLRYYYFQPHMCPHCMALWMWTRKQIRAENPGDHTDGHGDQLMKMLSGTVQSELAASVESDILDLKEPPVSVKQPVVDLIPRIVRENPLGLYFDLSVNGGKALLVKGFSDLVQAVDNEQMLTLGKSASPDFSKVTFTDRSQKWYDMIRDRVHIITSLNKSRNYGQYYYEIIPIGNSFALNGSVLDSLYALAEGTSVLYQTGRRNDVRYIHVGSYSPKASITLTPIKNGNKLSGITLEGKIPEFISGEQFQYFLDDHFFSQVSDDRFKYIRPFQKITSDSGHFRCTLGKTKFQEFMYRVLPALRESGQIDLNDNVSPLLENQLPPEPEFTFYVDLVDKQVTCRAVVQYGEYPPCALGFDVPDQYVKDTVQENRVLSAIRKYFPDTDSEKHLFVQTASDDNVIEIKTEGLPNLARFGIVNGSDAFRRIQFRQVPHASLNISLESDLLDLSIQTTDLSPDELLEVLASYRQKKRWHRLRTGDFVDLRHVNEFEDLDQTLGAMNLSLEELLKGDIHLPKYRALYVDKLLEAHDELAASRDREFKHLIRSFQTIKDSDFEAPKSLGSTLRSYQVYGFRWLSTVSAYGFGGILADEMGLGKTLQMLSWLQSQKDNGEKRPALVICPASLVYNWQEECRKFTPGLTAQTLDGNLDHRKELLAGIESGENTADLYITSYDLLRRDIAFYDKLYFSAAILDEAQYVKNQKAAVSKSVRILKASHHFALTGTPIENRLAELWSIFDFLMPGFLYTSSEFATQFETPIMKYKDPEATARLAKMTEPFILRRKKMDVLKDLPEKLEETRSAAMEEDQRKLYDAQVVHMKALLESSSDNNEDKMRILAEITRLRQICCDPSLIFENYHGSSAKRDACLDLIESAMDGGHRMLVFSQFTSMLALLAEDLKQADIPFFTITGATPKQERLRLVNEFNSGDVPVFLISLKAGGTGLNLTGADVVIHYDPWWNVAVQNQATDRAHRIGQTRQVTVIKLIAANTIEDRIVQLQEAKRDLAEAIISGESNSLMSLSKEELMELIG